MSLMIREYCQAQILDKINRKFTVTQIEDEIKNLIMVGLLVLASLTYCYFVVSKIHKGKLRVFCVLPVVFLFVTLPLFLSFVFPVGVTALFVSWLANFKLLLFAFDKGPLSSHDRDNFLCFVFKACLPIKIKQNKEHSSRQIHWISFLNQKNPPDSLLVLAGKVMLLAILLSVDHFREFVHPTGELLLYCFLVYLLVDIVFGVCNTVVHVILGMELDLPSDEPYLSTSLQDFWGRRWNLMVTNMLRHTVYHPVRVLSETLLGPQWAALPAVLATFLVSGLMHEFLFYCVTRAIPTWEVTGFFMLQGACLVVEFGLKRIFTGKWGRWWHWTASTVVTVGFVVVTAMWLFFPPLVRTGTTVRAMEEGKFVLDVAKSMPIIVWQVLSDISNRPFLVAYF